jgi:hypothetical protein
MWRKLIIKKNVKLKMVDVKRFDLKLKGKINKYWRKSEVEIMERGC